MESWFLIAMLGTFTVGCVMYARYLDATPVRVRWFLANDTRPEVQLLRDRSQMLIGGSGGLIGAMVAQGSYVAGGVAVVTMMVVLKWLVWQHNKALPKIATSAEVREVRPAEVREDPDAYPGWDWGPVPQIFKRPLDDWTRDE